MSKKASYNFFSQLICVKYHTQPHHLRAQNYLCHPCWFVWTKTQLHILSFVIFFYEESHVGLPEPQKLKKNINCDTVLWPDHSSLCLGTWAFMIFSLAEALTGFHEGFPQLLCLIGPYYQVPSQLFTFTGRDSKDKLQASLKDQKGFHIIWEGD